MKEKLRITFADRLAEAMDLSGVTRQQLATLTRGNLSHASNYLHARCLPRVDMLVLMADMLGCSVDYLLGRDGRGREFR